MSKIYGGLFTEEVKERHRKKTPREIQQERTKSWIKEQYKHCSYIEDANYDPSIVLKQLGRTLTSAELEKRLAKILPTTVVFIDNDYRRTKKAIIRVTRTGPETVCAYDRGLMPEHSILRVKTEEIPDPDFVSNPRQRVERSDLGKYEWNSNRKEYVFDNTTTRPGFKKVKVCYGEDPEGGRGWRTILIRLVESGLCSVDAVEREFGADNSPAWSSHLGKRSGIILPW